jgi:hypothetical protein
MDQMGHGSCVTHCLIYPQANDGNLSFLRQYTLKQTFIVFVVSVINHHKACLLRVDNDEQVMPALAESVARTCMPLMGQLSRPQCPLVWRIDVIEKQNMNIAANE